MNPFESIAGDRGEKTREEKIEKYLKEALPLTEPRIQQKMNPNCEIAIVVPSYGERNFIFRTIESFLDQKDVITDQFEVLIVVNNPAVAPTQKPSEENDRYDMRVKTYQKNLMENQEVLKIIRLRNGETVDATLTEKEQKLIDRVQEARLKIFAIDKASPGNTLAPGKDPTGAARNRGSAEAIERFILQGKNGILVHTDADTALAPNYLATVLKVFKQRPELVGAVASLEFDRPADDLEMQQLYFFAAMNRLCRNLVHYHQTGQQDYVKGVTFSGSAMVSRAYETALVGGIPQQTTLREGEDKLFGIRLSRIGTIDKIPELVVHPLDRVSVGTENLQKGHGHIRFTQAQQIKKFGEILFENMPISSVAEKIIKELCKNGALCHSYKITLKEIQSEDPPQLPAGIDQKFAELMLKLKAMDRAKRQA